MGHPIGIKGSQVMGIGSLTRMEAFYIGMVNNRGMGNGYRNLAFSISLVSHHEL